MGLWGGQASGSERATGRARTAALITLLSETATILRGPLQHSENAVFGT